MRAPLTHPISHEIYTEGICERCGVRSRVRAIQGEDGVKQLCARCHPPEPTEPTTTEGTT